MALYLKYRPKDFKSLVGQDFISNTLKEAVKEDKTLWAYLLCGPRWTGKTSTARILAKAVNCLNSKDWNPCNKCEICNWINNESLVDVIEIDAASNTWVDNIREIINKAQFRPTSAKFKIYIIDEVHMLSKGAFNALLKILEEPPEFVKFILATTETHKVPETIISRCQRFDFKNISEKDLKLRLEYIAKEENIEIDEQSLNYIVKNSAWWLRNAISLFEQLIVKDKIIFDTIIENLWIVNDEKLKEFLNKLKNKENEVINDFEELISSWKNIKLFFKELIFFTKQKTIDLVKNKKDISEFLDILDKLDETYWKTKNSLDENTTFLIGILKILNPEKNFPIIPFNKGDKNKSIKIEEKNKIEKNNTEKKIKIKIKEEIKVDDIWDIFWEEPIKNKEVIENISNNLTSSIFDKKAFTTILKELWAKWWLTMWIRGSDCYNNWNILEIKFAKPVGLESAKKPENISFIKQALEKMNMWELQVKLK